MKNRLRRLRMVPALRRQFRETSLAPSDFIYPIFVKEGSGLKEEISSMLGQYRWSIDRLSEILDEVATAEIPSVLLFGLTTHKDSEASYSSKAEGEVQQAIRFIKKNYPNIAVMTDVCVCAYMDHGHCGVVDGGKILNDPSLEILASMALSHAQAGADVVAPSAMMDGQVAAIRSRLDANGYSDVAIMGYSAKYYSACYGPFREAADSAPQWGDRASYQMDVANAKEALREAMADIDEGADMVMVKPGMLYLDIARQIADVSEVPLTIYNVSGEYAMVKAAAANGWIDGDKVMLEMLLSMKRAGVSAIITYFAIEASKLLKK